MLLKNGNLFQLMVNLKRFEHQKTNKSASRLKYEIISRERVHISPSEKANDLPKHLGKADLSFQGGYHCTICTYTLAICRICEEDVHIVVCMMHRHIVSLVSANERNKLHDEKRQNESLSVSEWTCEDAKFRPIQRKT